MSTIIKIRSIFHGSNLADYAEKKQIDGKSIAFEVARSDDLYGLTGKEVVKEMHENNRIFQKNMKNEFIAVELCPSEDTAKWLTEHNKWDEYRRMFIHLFSKRRDNDRKRDFKANKYRFRDYSLKNRQFIAFRHLQTTANEHLPHEHLLFNRVDRKGRTMDDFMLHKRAKWVAQEMDRRLKIPNAEERQQSAKDHIKAVCDQIMRTILPKQFSWNVLAKELAKLGIIATPVSKDDTPIGYRLKYGERDYKASSIQRDFTLSRIGRYQRKLYEETNKNQKRDEKTRTRKRNTGMDPRKWKNGR